MEKEFSVTPWEVSGIIDYSKLTQEFGISLIKELPAPFQKEAMFRRKIIFAHRDIARILDAIKNKKPFVMMTGLMPTGKFHLGHLLVAQQIIFYQKLGARLYIAVADIEAYTSRAQSLEESRKIALEEYLPSYLALGLRPEKCDVYFQSHRSAYAPQANAYYRLQNLLSRYATFNEFRAVYGEISPGKMLAALLQAADMLHPQLNDFNGPIPVLIPAGIDQDPHLRLARDISRRIKFPSFIQLSSTYHSFVPGLKRGKMSSSDANSYIALSDSPAEVKRKINSFAFSGGKDTLSEHRKHGGNPDIDVSFQYLKYLFEPDDKALSRIEKDYRSGKLLSGELKALTIKKINSFLKELQQKRAKAKSLIKNYI